MAWIRAMSPDKKLSVLYDSGTWYVDYDNPGGYTYTGYTIAPAVINASSFQINSSSTTVCAIGIRNSVDLTDVSTVKVRCYSTGAPTFCKVGVWSSKVLSNTPRAFTIVPDDVGYTEITIDVSDLTGYHYIACQSAKTTGAVAYFEKIWLE